MSWEWGVVEVVVAEVAEVAGAEVGAVEVVEEAVEVEVGCT
jgi:hypothetical protein